VKSINGLKAIDIVSFFPFEVVVADLFDEVFKLVSAHSSIEDLVDHVLFFVVDYYRRWRGVSLFGKGIVSGWAEERDVLYWVHFDVAGKIKLVRSVGDNFQDFERSYTSMVQLSA